MTDAWRSVAERIRTLMDEMTPAERQLAHIILANYPASGLGTLADLSRAAGVSVPTVARMVQKLGYAGFGAFQETLREELRAATFSPISKPAAWAETAPDHHVLNRFTEVVTENIVSTLSSIRSDEFDCAVDLIADPARRLYIVGGRITHTLAEYLYLHCQVLRKNVIHIQSTSNAWPHYCLDATRDDVFVIFDIRRYEQNTLRLAETVREKGARVVLFTDAWHSPVSVFADHTFAARTSAPSAWDSNVATLLLVEALIAAVHDYDRSGSRARLKELDEIFDRTRLFRKPPV